MNSIHHSTFYVGLFTCCPVVLYSFWKKDWTIFHCLCSGSHYQMPGIIYVFSFVQQMILYTSLLFFLPTVKEILPDRFVHFAHVHTANWSYSRGHLLSTGWQCFRELYENLYVNYDNSRRLMCSWAAISWTAQGMLMPLWFDLSESQVIDHLYHPHNEWLTHA